MDKKGSIVLNLTDNKEKWIQLFNEQMLPMDVDEKFVNKSYQALKGEDEIELYKGRFDDKSKNYDVLATEKEYPFSEIDNIIVNDRYVYCFTQMFQAVNMYDKDGKFQYSIKVPNNSNGKGYMYVCNNFLCIKNKRKCNAFS